MEQHRDKRYCLPKSMRLTGQKNIAELYGRGKKTTEGSLLAIYSPTAEAGCVRVLVAVPKRLFRHAADRNRYKRLLRESFRLNRDVLACRLEGKAFGLDIALVAIGGTLPSFADVERRVIALLNNIEV